MAVTVSVIYNVKFKKWISRHFYFADINDCQGQCLNGGTCRVRQFQAPSVTVNIIVGGNVDAGKCVNVYGI